nr:MAG TPA: hypothetical protein [Caudoviricetes sp.]
MEPQQMLFTYLLTALRGKGYSVYDGALPPEDTPYPFIYLGDSQTVDENRKQAVQGIVYQTIHIWHNKDNQRGTVSAMVLDVKTVCRELERQSGWLLSECSSQILPDNTTNKPLMHAVIEAGFKF